jgi:hypothetical protein
VYELQFAQIFINWLGQNNDVVRQRIAGGQNDACAAVFRPLIRGGKNWQKGWDPAQNLGLKKIWAAGDTPTRKQTAVEELTHLARISSMYLYLKDEHIINIFQAVSGRMRQFWAALDDKIKDAAAQGSVTWAKDINLEASYLDWEAAYFNDLDAKWAAYAEGNAKWVIDNLTPKDSAAIQAVIRNIRAQQVPVIGLLSPEAFSVAPELF